MHKQFHSFLLFFLIFTWSCNSKKNKVTGIQEADHKMVFLRIADLIRGQLTELDKIQLSPLKIVSYNGRSDSTWVKKEDIHDFANTFLTPDIDTNYLKSLFNEKSFLDQTINAITFSYDPISTLPDTMSLRRWDVYIDPEKQTIKRIYIVKEVKSNGKSQTLQLTWIPQSWAKINTLSNDIKNIKLVKEEKLIWNFDQ